MRTGLKQTIQMAAVVVSMALVSSCGSNSGTSPLLELAGADQMNWEKQSAALQAAPDCDGALASFKQMLTTGMLVQLEQQRQYYIDYVNDGGASKGGYGDLNMAAEDSSTGAPTQSDDAAQDYSETNVQVEGVDEADIVKVDGNLMVVLSGSDVVIVDAWPAVEMHELGRVTLKTQANGMYRAEDRIVALSYANRADFEPEVVSQSDSPDDSKMAPEGDYYYSRWEPMTLVTVIDISTPEAPVVVDETLYDGTLLGSRRIDNRLYLVQQDYGYGWSSGISYWPENLEWGASAAQVNAAFATLAQQNIDFINSLELSDVMPSSYHLDSEGLVDEASASNMTSCQTLYYPTVYSGTGLITAVTVDISGATQPLGSSVLGDWGTLYVSHDALYVAATNWSWWWWWSDGEELPDIVTQIHKFGFRGEEGSAVYQASGTVPGYVLNQFSLDEFDGNLRVATTLPDWGWWDENDLSESFVTVLGQEGNSLVQLGQVAGLGIGESIQSVRFIGDKGYVVTFRQIDPLYVLDLAAPAAPAMVGELKIPGFSSYIHPLDETHLLTIGRDGDENGSTFGISFQIFDVSDPTNPTQTAKTTLGEDDGWNSYLWSDALWDHHAFVYFASRQMLAVPVSGWDWSDSGGGTYTNMLQLFHVDITEGITAAGSVSHADLIGELPNLTEESSYCWYDLDWLLNDRIQIRRGVFMDDFIYSISTGAVKVHDLTNLDAGEVSHIMLSDMSDLPALIEQDYGYCWND